MKIRSSFVYRLEDAQGRGPFHPDSPDIQGRVPVGYHRDPRTLLLNAHLPQELLDVLLQAGFVFGWRTQRHYAWFVRGNNRRFWTRHGYRQVRYEPTMRFDFPDGQVLFRKPGTAHDSEGALLSVLQILSTKFTAIT